jgi:hypothetical protein
MLDTIRKEVKSKLQQVKENPVLCQYLKYIGISILLGVGFKYGYDGFVSLIKPLLDILHISSVSSIDHSYLFSASATILATIFTIIFVLLTVFVQVSDISVSADIFRSDETKNLVRLYFATIVLSLMMLEASFQFPTLVLTLTIACILLLYPFLRSISDKLVYDVRVVKLKIEIPSLIDSNSESLAIERLSSLTSTCKRSIQDNRIDAFFDTMGIFKTSILKAQQREMTNVVKIIGHDYLAIFDMLIKEDLTEIDRDTMNDPLFENIKSYISSCSEARIYKPIELQIHHLYRAGIDIIKADFDYEYVNQIVEILRYTFYDLQKNRRSYRDKEDKLEQNIVEHIGELSIALYNRKKELFPLNTPVEALFVIGAKSCQINERFGHIPSDPSRIPVQFRITEQLKRIENIIGSDNYESIVKELQNHYKYDSKDNEFEQYFNKFKEYYDRNKTMFP